MRYYNVRNSLILVFEHEKGVKKIVAYVYIMGRNIKRIISGDCNGGIMMTVYRDFWQRNMRNEFRMSNCSIKV